MKGAFDRAIGRVPMHLLAIIWLLVIVVVAFVLSFMGELFSSPWELFLSGFVLVATSVVVNALLAVLFRSAPHTRSAIITGLILFFLFWPVADPGGLAVLALTALLAIVSKYLIAVRGRHLFNPAALAAVIITLIGLNASVWWVATPALLPFVALGAFFVLYRTRKLLPGVLFIAVAAVVLVLRFVLGGADVGSAAAVAFTSLPIVFLAGFMLSEPLTLPPRRWQQLVVAAVVGVLFAIPYSFGPVFSTPELALVIGNLVAFVFIGTAGLHLVYRGKRQLTPSVFEFAFDAPRPLSVYPGQFVELSIPHRADQRGSRRPFSVMMAAGEAGRASSLTFGVRVSARPSSFKRALLELQPGTRIRGTWAGGDFLAPRDRLAPQLLVAGGVGITPFVSELRELGREQSEPRDVVVIYSVPSIEDAAYLDVIADSGVPAYLAITESDLQPTTLPDTVALLPPGRLRSESLRGIPDLAARQARVSGPPAFVDATRTALRRAGVRHIRTDYFSGY